MTYNFVEVSVHNLENSQRFPYTMFTLQTSFTSVQTTFAQGGAGGVKSVSRGDFELQGGKIVRLLSQLRPRIRPLETEEGGKSLK